MLVEIEKLEAVRAIGLPAGLFADVTPRVLAGWRQQAAVESPSHLREHSRALRLTLLAALLHSREREITDGLVDLLISTVHRIGRSADKKVTQELIGEFKRVAGKETLLFRVAEASVARPDGMVKDVIFPAVGGEGTLRDLIAEYKSAGPTYRRTLGDQLVIPVEQRPVLNQLVQVERLSGHRGKFRVRSETEQTPKRSIGEARSWALKHDLGTGSSDTTGRNGTHVLLLPTAARGGSWPSRKVRLASASRFLSDSDAARTSCCCSCSGAVVSFAVIETTASPR